MEGVIKMPNKNIFKRCHDLIKKELSEMFGYDIKFIINGNVAKNDLISSEYDLECGVRIRERQYTDCQYYQII